jgi:hypothetical protein
MLSEYSQDNPPVLNEELARLGALIEVYRRDLQLRRLERENPRARRQDPSGQPSYPPFPLY